MGLYTQIGVIYMKIFANDLDLLDTADKPRYVGVWGTNCKHTIDDAEYHEWNKCLK